MKKIILIVIMLLSCAAAYCRQSDNIMFYSTWDDRMLYFAVSAQGPDIRATHKEFNSPIDGDDGVEIFLNLSEDRSASVYSDKTAYIAVSAAGGFEFRRGNGSELVRENLFTHRYGVDVQGNLNDTANIDSGYSVELALPWSVLGGENMSYKALGIDFRITVCGKSYYLTGPDTFTKPDKCIDLLLSKFATITSKGAGKIICNHYMAEPRINGELKDGEWYSRTAWTFEVPVDGSDPYELVFTNQPVKTAVFDPQKGTGGFFDDPVRVGYLRQSIRSLAEGGADVLAIPADNPYLFHIFEALKANFTEGSALMAVSPSLIGAADARRSLFDFYAKLPEQLRRTVLDSEGRPGFPVYTDSPDESLREEFRNIFARELIFRSPEELEAETRTEKPKKAYSYLITGLVMPEGLNPRVGRQCSIFIKNTGTLTWKSGEAELVYRWYINGRFYSNGISAIPIMRDVAPGAVFQLNTILAPVTDKRKALPAGEAICELDITTAADRKSMAKPEGDGFFFKTIIEEPALYADANTAAAGKALKEAKANAPAPYVVSAEEPVLFAPGGAYRISLDVMNTTCEKWMPDKTFVEAEICLYDGNGNISKEYKGRKAVLELKAETPDGTLGLFDGYVEAGKLRVIDPGSDMYYAVKYTLCDKKARTDLRKHYILSSESDDNQRIVALKLPERENDLYALHVAVRNAGVRKWPCADTYLTASWYAPDGTLVKKDFYRELLKAPEKKAKTFDPGTTAEKVIYFKEYPGPGTWLLVAELTGGDKPFNNPVMEKPGDRLIMELAAD
ncbi:MAG: hypothetical protein IJT95_06320 [Abditibacteriota bacterium]|nr:hypothetical protein [Abditibacteriota bacterium]